MRVAEVLQGRLTNRKHRMGIGSFWRNRQRKAFVQRAEGLAGSIQLEIYKHAKAALTAQYGVELAGKVAAGIANFVCRFGYVNPEHSRDEQLVALFESERSGVLRSLGRTFKTNATGVLILLGAAWAVDHAKFKAHMSLLARAGFATIGRDTPDVSHNLPEADVLYMYEVVAIEADA